MIDSQLFFGGHKFITYDQGKLLKVNDPLSLLILQFTNVFNKKEIIKELKNLKFNVTLP